MSMISDFTTGSPAREDEFFFRKAYIDDLWDSLRKEHVLILAPRRMGKTSVMLRLQDEPRGNRLVVFLNVEEIDTPAEFCADRGDQGQALHRPGAETGLPRSAAAPAERLLH